MAKKRAEQEGFAGVYAIELLYSKPPELKKMRLMQAVAKRNPATKPMEPDVSNPFLGFVHEDLVCQFSDGSVPAQCLVTPADKPVRQEQYTDALQQTWDWEGAAGVVSKCTHAVLVTDFMARTLDYKPRLERIQMMVDAVLEVAPCAAISWGPSGKVVDPVRFVRSISEDGFLAPFPGAINVRFFNVQRQDGDKQMVMDTLGLAALGLADFQCHFRGLDPGKVSAVLGNTAAYILENGPVIEHGHTIQGVESGSKWRCRLESALVPPKRNVLDCNPGKPFAAGNYPAE